jgi:hypothetical protein
MLWQESGRYNKPGFLLFLFTGGYRQGSSRPLQGSISLTKAIFLYGGLNAHFRALALPDQKIPLPAAKRG